MANLARLAVCREPLHVLLYCQKVSLEKISFKYPSYVHLHVHVHENSVGLSSTTNPKPN